MDEPGGIRVDQFLGHPPARVWQALTDRELLARWLMPNDFVPVLGHRFTFTTRPQPGFDGIVHCAVLDIEVDRLLRISWRGGSLADTTVTWRLIPEGGGTRLFLEHDGFDPDDAGHQSVRRLLGGGWRSMMTSRLTACLTSQPRATSEPR